MASALIKRYPKNTKINIDSPCIVENFFGYAPTFFKLSDHHFPRDPAFCLSGLFALVLLGISAPHHNPQSEIR
jgi:hypothetical protein